MKIHPDCRPCLIRQMETTARAAGAGEDTVREVAAAAAARLDQLWDDTLSPPAVSAPLYAAAAERCRVQDPYLAMKIRYTREALRLLPELEGVVGASPDPLEAAVRVAIAGNVIDFGTGVHSGEIDLPGTLARFLEKPLFQDDIPGLKEKLLSARSVLYIGDNAGETVFDRPLLRLLARADLVYAAKGGAIINDATLADAALAGVHLHSRLVDTGASTPGTILEECSPQFRELFDGADVIIAKGQGNFETLTELAPDGRIFMLFTVKCPVAARHLGAAMGDLVVKEW